MGEETDGAASALEDLWRTAYHEAGHAVVAEELGLPVTWVSVTPGSGLRGQASFIRDLASSEKTPLGLAGLAAEEMALGDVTEGDRADYELLCAAVDPHRMPHSILRRRWPAVELIARALLEYGRLSGEQVRGLIALSEPLPGA